MSSDTFEIRGMDCPDCARTLERGVAQLTGVSACAVDFAAARLRVDYSTQPVERADIVARIRALGYDTPAPSDNAPALIPSDTAPEGFIGAALGFGRYLLSQRASGVPLVIGGALLLAGLLLGWLAAPVMLVTLLELSALVIAGIPVVRAAARDLFVARRVTINLLMAIAAIGALLIGEAAEAAAVMVLFALGEALEGFTMERARDSLRALTQLTPAEANVLAPCIDCEEHLGQDGYNGGECPWCAPHPQRRPVAGVVAGELVLVRPGERIPLDGAIVRGSSFVSQQYITGESMPVARDIGDEVYAGSINGDGALEIRVSAPASDSMLSRIATLVQAAQSRRAPVERFIDRFAAIYTPAVVVLAVLVATVPVLLFGQPFWDTADGTHGWLYRALALLVIACPCALVISTPVTVVSALYAATRAGILIKGGAALEALRRVRVAAFDKTGTLTSGQPRVTGLQCADGCCPADTACDHCNDLLALAAAVERQSAHPLAAAVVSAAEVRHVSTRYNQAEAVTALNGRGIRGQVAGRTISVGSHSWFDAEHAHQAEFCAQVAAAEQQGQTTLLVCDCDAGGVQGYLTVADTVRPQSANAVAQLRHEGVGYAVLLSGDTQAAAEMVGRQVGVDEIRGGLLPADKLAAIGELEQRRGPVMMIGDGVNDTPALAAATVGVAMGAAGSAPALETADVALLDDDLRKLPFLMRLGRRAGTIMRWNIAVSLGAKLIFLVLALFGLASLWAAILADTGVALLVILNGMRLLRETPRR